MIAALLLLLAAAQDEWPTYGNDPGGTRYSTLDQINRSNVAGLKVAWTYRTGAPAHRKAAFEATPILVDGTLYLSTPFNKIIALDPATGAERWTYDPQVDGSLNYSEVTSRGVSAWLDPQTKQRRIFAGTIDARLIALDAKTGKPCPDFGRNGQVDLWRNIGLKDPGDYQATSPPAVIGNLVVVGSSIGDNRRVDVEKGAVRAFDARTGVLRWRWEPLPAGSLTGAANAWAVMSADPERDLVFIPTGSASPDFYGGRRPGDNRWANSVVALRASSGQLVWGFQVVHHDLWDYDVAAQPSLVTVRRGGREAPAVAVTTKMGHLFLLERESGKPLLGVEERPVPRSDVPGEEAWPTQPIPVNAPLAPQRLTAEQAWGATPEDRAACRERLLKLRNDGLFTPPSLRGSLFFPGNVGGVNWGGAAVDPARQLLVTATNRLPTMVRLIPREEYRKELRAARDNRLSGEFGEQAGTPYAMYRETFTAPSGLPCNPPPWGALSAIDLATGALRWEVPLGEVTLPGGAKIQGAPSLGGPLATAGGLVFIAASIRDEFLRGFDIDSGRLLWQAQLPAGAQSTPMTYSIHGKQFVVIAAGGHGKAGSKAGDFVVAFALP